MRLIALILCLFHAANGVLMLAAPDFWYRTVPGVVETGPLNSHFARDIGLAFIASATALGAWAHTAALATLWPAVIFLGGHTLLHLAELAIHQPPLPTILRDFVLILLPGLLPAAILYRSRAPQ